MADPTSSAPSKIDTTTKLDDINLETADKVLICKYIAYKFYQYVEINAKDQSL